MEPAHRARLTRLFPTAVRGKRPVCLDVLDQYHYMDPERVRFLRDCVGRAIPALATHESE
jgi:predicted protein tyrosine phosphatase